MTNLAYIDLLTGNDWVVTNLAYIDLLTSNDWVMTNLAYIDLLTSSDWLLLAHAVHLPEIPTLLLAHIVDPRIEALLQVLFQVLRNDVVELGTVVEELAFLRMGNQRCAVPRAIFDDGEWPRWCRCQRSWWSRGCWAVAGMISVVTCQQWQYSAGSVFSVLQVNVVTNMGKE